MFGMLRKDGTYSLGRPGIRRFETHEVHFLSLEMGECDEGVLNLHTPRSVVGVVNAFESTPKKPPF